MNRRIKVHGKVQGVFFRKNTQQKALELDLKGWVKNEDDGTVSLEIEGELHSILAMQSWLRLGPPNSQVEYLEISQGEEQGYQDFLILQ
ncbi:acylphosphatase [Cecembia calidifontis]|uniref:Acylphosphatase n=1 Tax=Cecembia calidifontis TaxID=1187080 RepID=A0A4Q7P598_9BACT|nr:acylphosphatase [Cecembia calidifontis]RZS95111.1 acylphosphatase [Cecembia calidifontis]